MEALDPSRLLVNPRLFQLQSHKFYNHYIYLVVVKLSLHNHGKQPLLIIY
jgi:hypothetical protein